MNVSARAEDGTEGEYDLYENVVFLLPEDAQVTVDWYFPPAEPEEMKESGGPDIEKLAFVVDPEGTPWLALEGLYLVNLYESYMFQMSEEFNDAAFMSGGSLLLTTEGDLGFPAYSEDYETSDVGLPEVPFQPLANLPAPNSRAFAGDENAIYLVAFNVDSSEYETYLLQPESSPVAERPFLKGYKKLFTSEDKIDCVTGDGDVTYFAQGRRVLRLSHEDASFVRIIEHPSEDITQLVYTRGDGLFYATSSGVGYTGPNDTLEFMAAPEPLISLSAGTLYIFLPESYGIIGIDNVKELQKDNLVTAETKELIGIDRATAMAALELDNLDYLYYKGTLGKITEDERFTGNPEFRSILVQRLQELSRKKIEDAGDRKSKDLDDANKLLTLARRIIEKYDMEREAPEVYFNLGLLAGLRGKEGEGIRYLNRFLYYSKNPDDRAEAVERIARLMEAKEKKDKEREKKRSRFTLGFSWANGVPRGVLSDLHADSRSAIVGRFGGPLVHFGYGLGLETMMNAVFDVNSNPLPDFPEYSYWSFSIVVGLSFRANQAWTGQYFDVGLGMGSGARNSEESELPVGSYIALSSGFGGGLLLFASDRVSFDFGYHIFTIHNEGKQGLVGVIPKLFNDDYGYLSAGMLFFIF